MVQEKHGDVHMDDPKGYTQIKKKPALQQYQSKQ